MDGEAEQLWEPMESPLDRLGDQLEAAAAAATSATTIRRPALSSALPAKPPAKVPIYPAQQSVAAALLETVERGFPASINEFDALDVRLIGPRMNSLKQQNVERLASFLAHARAPKPDFSDPSQSEY